MAFEDWEISTRSANALHNHGIHTDEQLVRLSTVTMKTWNYCGEKTINEISKLAGEVEKNIYKTGTTADSSENGKA
jgi:DNA-directed RNA polymerase alpha subunit